MNQDNNDGIFFDTGREHRRWRRVVQWWWRRRQPHGAATARPTRPAGHSLACTSLPACPALHLLTDCGEGHARKSIFGPNPAFSAFTKAAMVGCVLYKLEAKLSRSLE